MSFQHNQLAHAATTTLLASLRSGPVDWLPEERLGTHTTYWQGVLDWPRPDHAFQDSSTGGSLATEFKPPGHGKSEYVRGLGQTLTYLDAFELAILILPEKSSDGYKIADYLGRVVQITFPTLPPIGILSYGDNPETFRTVIGAASRLGDVPSVPTGRAVFWAYWRDLSQYEVLVLLQIMDRKHLSFDDAFEEYWFKWREKGKALMWEGKQRKKPQSEKTHSSEKLNAGLSLCHTGIVDTTGRMTAEGYDLLRSGKVYGPRSAVFLMKLTQRILLEGRHLDLIFWVDETQKSLAKSQKLDHLEFRKNLDRELQDAGVIQHLPGAGGKVTFLRDEPKLWKKLGLLESTGREYFHHEEGYRFNWRRIVSVIGQE